MIHVKLVQLGSEIKEYALETGANVAQLLDAAGETYVDGSVTRNGSTVCRDTVLYDRDKVFIGKATKGNVDPFEVTFVRLGDTSISLPAEDGYTIERTLQQLPESEKGKFFRADGKAAYEFRVGGGAPVELSYVISRPASGNVRVICSQRVKGN